MVTPYYGNQPSDESVERLNQVFDALRNPYRRRVLRLLADEFRHEEGFTLAELHAGTVDFASFKTKLVHSHLPKLEDAGYIEWEKADDKIWCGPRFDEIAPVVELLDEHQDELPGEWLWAD